MSNPGYKRAWGGVKIQGPQKSVEQVKFFIYSSNNFKPY